MKNGVTIYKYSVLAIIVAATLWFFRDCRGGKGTIITHDTISTYIDTGYTYYKHDTSYIPRPYKVIYPVISEVHDTLMIEEKPDTSAILYDYWTKKYYRDTVKVEYGNVVIEDTVEQNALRGQSARTNLNIPVITKTITLQAPKKNVVYFGFDLMADKNWLLASTGFSLGLKFKSDKMIELKTLLTKAGSQQFGAGIRWPIRLHK